jgi:hypothetical protein
MILFFAKQLISDKKNYNVASVNHANVMGAVGVLESNKGWYI